MKTIFLIVISLCLISCEKQELFDPEDLKTILPAGWELNIMPVEILSHIDIDIDAAIPEKIIRFVNSGKTFQHNSKSYNPELVLYFYNIKNKEKLQNEIRGKAALSHLLVPLYYAQTRTYYILTSPISNNHAIYTDEANQTIEPLHKALKEYFDKLN